METDRTCRRGRIRSDETGRVEWISRGISLSDLGDLGTFCKIPFEARLRGLSVENNTHSRLANWMVISCKMGLKGRFRFLADFRHFYMHISDGSISLASIFYYVRVRN